MSDADNDHSIEVEVVFAIDQHCWRRRVVLSAGSSAADALAASGLESAYRHATGQPVAQMGIFGRRVGRDHVMQSGERLALYRPLQADPRQRRRERAASR